MEQQLKKCGGKYSCGLKHVEGFICEVKNTLKEEAKRDRLKQANESAERKRINLENGLTITSDSEDMDSMVKATVKLSLADRVPAAVVLAELDPLSRKKLLRLRLIAKRVALKMGRFNTELQYEAAMMQELTVQNIHPSKENPIELMYNDTKGEETRITVLRSDISITKWLNCILELKSLSGAKDGLKNEDKIQLVDYMRIKDVPYGMLFNFTKELELADVSCCLFVIKFEGKFHEYNPETDVVGKEVTNAYKCAETLAEIDAELMLPL